MRGNSRTIEWAARDANACMPEAEPWNVRPAFSMNASSRASRSARISSIALRANRSEVRRHLIVPAAARVKFQRDRPDLLRERRFDEGVDVFVRHRLHFVRRILAENAFESAVDGLPFFFVEDAGAKQPLARGRGSRGHRLREERHRPAAIDSFFRRPGPGLLQTVLARVSYFSRYIFDRTDAGSPRRLMNPSASWWL